jgi:hypothetical protein
VKPLNQEAQQKIPQKIAKWKAGLADLGRKNPLIKFQPDNRRTLEVLTDELDIIFTDFVEKKKTFKFSIVDSNFQDNVLSKSTKALSSSKNPLELITRQTGNEQIKRLKTLRTEARKSIEERGFNSLFLAMGTLTWYDKDKPEEALLSPLILIPVELNKEPRREIYKISALEDDIVINPTLTQKLKQNFGLELLDIEAIQEPTYKKIIDQIKLVLVGQKLWEINDSLFISLFSYAKAAIVKDITENETRIFSHPILQAISGDVTNYESNRREPLPEYALDSQIKPEKIFQILDADSSQQVVIEAAKAGSSFVVQGPPGTGKSQTIVNMIAELVGAGKSVLLVAEKETALSVVYKRMAECGLDHVCLNLHHSGTTDKKKLVNNLSKTIDYLAQISATENYHIFFEQLVSTRQSLNSYLTSLHTKEQPLDQSAFELYGEILQKEREAVPDINVILSNFNQWNQSRLVEAKNLLNQLAQFLPFFKGEKTTIWSRSFLKSYTYELELEIREKLADFQQAILVTQNLSQKLSSIIQLQSISNLDSLETYYKALSYVSKAPLQLPENWNQINIAIARNAFNILRQDVREIAMRMPSQEVLDLLNHLSSFMPFLREEITNIWERSKSKFIPESQELEISQKLDKFQKSISLIQDLSQSLQRILGVETLLNLENVETYLPALKHILNAPANLPNDWTLVDISTAENVFTKLQADIKFLEENEPFIKQKYHSDLFSSELPGLANRFQKYSRFWIFRVLNPRYRRDIKLLKRLRTTEVQLSYKELKQDLAQAVKIQAARNELYQSNYPSRQIFGSLFNPEFATQVELRPIEQALSWLNKLKQYSLPTVAVQHIVNSHSLRQELAKLIQKLESFNEDFQQGINFLLLYFNESNIVGQVLPHKQILFTDLANFISLAKTDIQSFRDWLRFKEIYDQLENLGAQAFIEALRNNKPNPVVALRNKLSQVDYLPNQIFGSLFHPQMSSEDDLKPIEAALDWLIGLQNHSLPGDSVQQIINLPSRRRELSEIVNGFSYNVNEIKQVWNFILSYFRESDITDSYLTSNQITFEELEIFLNLAESELQDFQGWLTYKETCEQLEKLGIKKFIDALRDSQIEPEQWYPSLEKLIYRTCLDAIWAKKPELKNFNPFIVHRLHAIAIASDNKFWKTLVGKSTAFGQQTGSATNLLKLIFW